MANSFRQIADELDPNYVPEWVRRGRRPVPPYVKALLSLLGQWWLPRLGIGLVVVGTLVEVGAMIVFASRAWLAAILLFGGGVLAAIAGSVMWSAYRMRHWLPGGAASTAPLAPPVPRRAYVWMGLAVLGVVGGLGLMLWLMMADGSARAVVIGVGVFMVCAGTASAVLVRQANRASIGGLSLGGLPAHRVGLLMFVISLILGAMLLAQAPMLPATR